MSEPKTLREQAREIAGHLTTCSTVARLSTPAIGDEFTPIIEAALQKAREAALAQFAVPGSLAAEIERLKADRDSQQRVCVRQIEREKVLRGALEFAESVYRQNCVSPGEPSSVLAAMQEALARAGEEK